MKRIMMPLLLVALLLVMTACGGMNGDKKARTNNPRVGDVETPAQRSGNGGMQQENNTNHQEGSTMRGAADRAMEDTKETLDGSSWDEMVRNGRVRDRDGDLKDGENALHGRYGTVR